MLRSLVEEVFLDLQESEPKLNEILGPNHHRIGAALECVRASVSGGALTKASRDFDEFGFELEMHLRAEEDVIFRELERLENRSEERATVVLRMEHGQIRESLAETRDRFRGATITVEVVEHLGQMIRTHQAHEELLLCSLLEQVDDPRAVRRVLRCLELCLDW